MEYFNVNEKRNDSLLFSVNSEKKCEIFYEYKFVINFSTITILLYETFIALANVGRMFLIIYVGM